MIDWVRRWLLLAAAILGAAAALALSPSTTTGDSATYAYDASSISRVGVHADGEVRASQAHGKALESVSRSADARRASTTLAATYDAPAIARVDIDECCGTAAVQAQLSGALDESASPSDESRGASTTPVARSNATNTARGGAGPVRVGQRGLDALGVTQNTTRIALPGGGYRVPDWGSPRSVEASTMRSAHARDTTSVRP